MKRISITFAVLISACSCLASGWNDFRLDIGDGYTVYRANSMDVGIGKAGSLILYPRDDDNVGPVVGYITTPEYILTKNLGKTPRNLFESDTAEVDASQEFFFVIAKGTDELHGPFSEDEFAKRPEVINLGQLDWQIPKNPNFWRPLLGSLWFLAFAIPFLAIKFFWITVPVVIGLIVLIIYTRKRRREPQNRRRL